MEARLTFSSLELGLMFLILTCLFLLCRSQKKIPLNPLYVFGRTPLFFYILHVHFLTLTARLLGLYRSAGLTEAFIATLGVLLIMYPLCRWYFGVKRSRPRSFLRFVWSIEKPDTYVEGWNYSLLFSLLFNFHLMCKSDLHATFLFANLVDSYFPQFS